MQKEGDSKIKSRSRILAAIVDNRTRVLDLDLYLGIQTAVMMILKAFQTQLTISKPYSGQHDVVA